MVDTITPPDYLRVGVEVAVVSGAGDSVRVREIAKINKRHFTVHGITDTGRPDGRPVQFRIEGGDGKHTAAGDTNRDVAYRPDHVDLAGIRRGIRERNAIRRVKNAAHAFEKLEQSKRSPWPDKRPSAAAIDDALAELADAAVALRGVLGVPDGTGEG